MKGSSDRKVQQFKYHQNSFGLPAVLTCPGATDGEDGCLKVCYAEKLSKAWTSVNKFLLRNYDELKEAKTPVQIYRLLSPLVEHSHRQYHAKLVTATGVEERRLRAKGHIFRWNWSGDVHRLNVARAITRVCHDHPHTTFWIYTRSYWLVPILLGARNLIVNLSIDPVNEDSMRQVWIRYYRAHNLRLTWMGQYPPDWMKGDYIPLVTCPEQTGKLKLQGACSICGLCLNKKKRFNIRFITGKE